jgi:DNA replication and repair protein RecF
VVLGLLITSLELKDFRNYQDLEIKPDPKLTILVGSNAAGKTNIIEAVELLTAAVSFRRPPWGEVVRWGQQEAHLSMKSCGGGRSLDVSMGVTAEGKRTYQVNGKTRRTVSQVAGRLPCVLFTPDDLGLVKDSADKRRSAVDGVGDQLSAAYRESRTEYERILRQRNSLLKDASRDKTSLEMWTHRLVERGAAYSARRRRLFDRVSERMSEVYRTLVQDEVLEACYEPSWEGLVPAGTGDSEAMEAALVIRGGEEARRGITLVGPHRDEMVFSVDGKNARRFASQGQQRTIALAWKLAEVQVITEIGGQPPVLLLDDVMSELDESRRHALARFVGETAQTFVTTTNLGYFDEELVERAKTVTLT